MAVEGGPFDDVRMRGFARRTPAAEVWAWLDAQIAPLEGEEIPLAEAAGRVLVEDIVSPRNVPPFARAMMDGYAVWAADTLGASAYHPIRLAVVGQALPGRPFLQPMAPGQAVQIMTGAPLPAGADAVLPAELSEPEGPSVLVQGEVSPGKHVGPIGEDIAQGAQVLHAGRVLRPQDVGLLASLGLTEVRVVRRPRVRIIITGDELLPAGTPWEPHHIYDANGPMLQALVRRDGGTPDCCGIVPDRPDAILDALRGPTCSVASPTGPTASPSRSVLPEAAPMGPAPIQTAPTGADAETQMSSPYSAKVPVAQTPAQTPSPIPDVILISGGSSVGQEDHAPRLLAEQGRLVFHGLAMRPSSPAGVGLWEDRLVFLLPGNPVSCLCAYDFFAGRAIRALGGRSKDWPYRRLTAPLARKVSSQIGRLDYLRVRLVEGKVEPISISGAGVLSTTTQADGFVLIPPESEGYPAGAPVEVFLYDA